jgi:hypothetical protein
VAKRSPILGYNHNVRYRGLVFHVQTEDSGLLNPHLFTHLFHGGVIVSTRKLVYDAGSNEEAIKSLMQAQHKAVMKDLRRGTFDDKIEAYLGNTPGLEPRPATRATPDPTARPDRAKTEADAASPLEIVNEALSEPIELPVKQKGNAIPTPSRAGTGDRTIPVTALPPQPKELDAPTDRQSVDVTTTQPLPRTTTAQKVSRTPDVARAPTQLAARPAVDDAAPVIELEVDDESDRSRVPRDTAVEQSRPPSHGAATLPAMKPPSRPIAPPVVTRPSTQDRKRADSDAVEVYSPAPPSAEPPPGERAERPGQYSMSRKEGAAIREKTGRIEKIQPANAAPAQPSRSRTGGSSGGGRAAQPPPTPQRPQPSAGGARGPAVSSQPHRPHATAPITSRAPSPASPPPGSGVVMTRPAVIVGAAPKQAPTQQRVRKAREDEGRGFGQGLISEKSLDEVILAYLSEDAEDK